MISLSAIGKQEKNKLSTDSTFIVLVEIQLKDDVIRLCYNTEDVYWNNQLWQAFPMQLGEVGEDGAGSDPNVELKVDNVSQALQYHVEEAGGGVGLEVIIRVVNTKALDYEEPETEEKWELSGEPDEPPKRRRTKPQIPVSQINKPEVQDDDLGIIQPEFGF